MRLKLIASICLTVCFAASLLAQQGSADPLSGAWFGFYGTTPRDQSQVRLKLDWDAVIPGHGPMTNRAGFLQWRAAVDVMTNRMRSMVREGRTKTEVEEMLVNEFKWERTGMPFRSVEGMIAELK